jgi:hypothetical protein
MPGKIGRGYVDQVNAFAKAQEIPVVWFGKGMVKEDVARPYMQEAEREHRSGVVMLGVAQEKAFAWRGWRQGGNDAHPASGDLCQPLLLSPSRSNGRSPAPSLTGCWRRSPGQSRPNSRSQHERGSRITSGRVH